MEMTKKQLQDRLKYLEDFKLKAENNSFAKDPLGNKKDWSVIKKMLAYEALSQVEKDALEEDWQAYFVVVHNSVAYKRYQQQREVLRRNNLAEVKRLAQEARQEREQKTDWIPKPSSIDPALFEVDDQCKRYKWVIYSIAEIRNKLKKMGDEEVLEEDNFSEAKEIFENAQ